jgi:hypothetical protein
VVVFELDGRGRVSGLHGLSHTHEVSVVLGTRSRQRAAVGLRPNDAPVSAEAGGPLCAASAPPSYGLLEVEVSWKAA